ncbi:protein kinase domain-containing protein [Tautonia plasticadhaerens]|uniref:Serine/threonine-protein kinase Pkn1 n=1 Tax=Tautonia plasticadhaerens TaxID=2527974 RepID=A0A518H4J3_9BACT|nr:SUMF1/EgtB/PvdO family nonheme iron enzyme [Tautonia plasticadhaerens]QDV35759.1 Serine/threonine-protein kinase Pkn1 [Tautonia plasticadhaerens]
MIRMEDPGNQPSSIPGFEMIRPIGRGGMGEVFLARQISLDRPVAIKLLHPVYQALSDERLVRFRREAELMARVNHPNVLTVFDLGQVSGRPYLVMGYAEGGDLRRLMRAGVPMAADAARALIEPVGRALACLHRNGILHRDLKPENVLLDDDGRPLVADFGIAVLRGGAGALTGTGIGLGTPGYIAPEQQYRLKIDERADQYSLAALSYELLTGQVPLGVPRPPSSTNAALPGAIDSVLLRALADDPEDRFADVPAFLQALDAAFSRPPAPRGRGRKPAMIALGSTIALATFVAGVLLARSIREARPAPWRQVPAPPTGPVAPPSVASGTTPTELTARGSGPGPESEPDPGVGAGPGPAAGADPGPAAGADPGRAIADAEPADRLVPFLEDQLERFAVASPAPRPPGGDCPREAWLDAIDTLLGHGPLAGRLKARIDEIAFQIWDDNGRPEGTSDADWLEARRRLFESDGLDPLIQQLIGEEAVALWERKGQPEGKDEENWFQARHRLVDEGLLLPARVRDNLENTFLLVPAGELDVPDQPGGPGPTLVVDRPFYLADREVTVGLFARFVQLTGYRTTAEVEGSAIGFDPETGGEVRGPQYRWRNPGYPGGVAEDHPVAQVSWDDAIAFCREATSRLGTSYRLPTEREWRYARHLARRRAREAGEAPGALADEAWYLDNSDRAAHPVGSKRPDGLGFYDLLGNAAEWCADSCEVVDPRQPDAPPGPGHPVLGGSWINTADQLRPGVRPCFPPTFYYPSIGFRLCVDLPDVR